MKSNGKLNLLKAGAIYTIANVLLKGISFFTIPLFIRLLTPEEFGRFNVFISFEGIIFMFSGLTLHASIKNAFYDKKDDYETYVKNCVYVDFFNSILIAIIANTVCFLWSDLIDLKFPEINLLVLSGFCSAITAIYGSSLIMEYKAGDYAIMSFLSIVSGIVLSLALIFTLFDFDHYLGRIIGLVIGHVVAASYAMFKLFRSGFSHINLKYWKYGLNISIPIIPHGLSQIILSSANRIMIKYLYNAAQAGIFSFTYTISMVPQVLFQSVTSVWEPWFFEKMNQKEYSQIKQKSTLFCILISVVFVLLSCVTPEVIKLLATQEYYDAIDISIIVLIGCYFATLYIIPCEVEYFYKKTKHIAISTFLCAIINVGANLILMQYFTYKIAAYVTFLAYFLYFCFHMFMSYYIGKKMFFDIKKMIFIISFSLIVMIAIYFSIENIFMRIGILIIFGSPIIFYKQRIIINLKEIKNGKNYNSGI